MNKAIERLKEIKEKVIRNKYKRFIDEIHKLIPELKAEITFETFQRFFSKDFTEEYIDDCILLCLEEGRKEVFEELSKITTSEHSDFVILSEIKTRIQRELK